MRAAWALLFTVACTEPPIEVVRRVTQAITLQDEAEIWRRVDLEYADPLGGKDVLEADLAALFRDHGSIRLDLFELYESRGASELEAKVGALIDGELIGEPTWKIDGTIGLELRRVDGWRIRSGLLTELRSAKALMDQRRAALEANDAEAIRPLLHPNYRDGDLDADQAIARLKTDLEGVKIRLLVTNRRLELRGTVAHVDEHYRLTVGEKTLAPSVGRFTLEKSTGQLRIKAGLYPSPSP